MAGLSFLRNVTGRVTEILGLQVSAGAGDAGKIPALDATGRLDNSMMPVGIAADTATMLASENLAAGDFVNVFLSAGVIKARKADATSAGKEARGFVLAAVLSGANATVYFEGRNTSVTGKTIGSLQYLSAATPGGSVEPASAPVTGGATGNVVQYLGVAISATEINFEPEDGIILA